MNKIRLFLKLIIFTLLALSTSLQAGISPLAFNGVFECFKPEYKMCAPNFGCAALQAGLVNNLRFCMVEPGRKDANGNRLWIEDKAPADDPIAALAVLLFPSPAGNLTAMTSHKTNLGKDLSVVQLAQLLNFCAHVRTLIPSMGKHQFGASGSKCLNLLASLAQRENKPYFKNFFAKTFGFEKNAPAAPQAYTLISVLCKIIELEEKSGNATLESFYPKFQAEQLLNAFFCLKFGPDDILTLLKNLDDSIVNKEMVNRLTDLALIEKSDIEKTLQKQVDNITLDDLWILQNRDLVDQIIPYARGSRPVNNGLACAYNRTLDQLITDVDFPDCTETVIRHLCNLLLYSKNIAGFNLSLVRERLKDSPYLKNLEEFYVLQTPDKANSGEEPVRNSWSRVVGSLGHSVRYKEKSVANELQNDTEISSGIINIMRVLNIIFNLELDAEPIYQDNQQFAEEVSAWTQIGLEKMFELIKPDKEISIDITEIKVFRAPGDYEYDCQGTIHINVNDEFEFDIAIKNGHAQFDSINVLTPQSEMIAANIVDEMKEKFRPDFHNNIGQSLFLLDSETDEATHVPFYDLFQNGINDSMQIMQTLKQLLTMTRNNAISLSRAKTFLRNCLQMFLWQDHTMTKKIQPIIKQWKDFIANQTTNTELINVLQNEVKAIRYDLFSQDCQNNPDNLFNFFKNVSSVFSLNKKYKNNFSSFIMQQKHESITEMDLFRTEITELTISGDTCPNLKILNLYNNKQLKKITFCGVLEKLVEINIAGSAITELEISGESCPNLEILNLYNAQDDPYAPQIKELQLSGIFGQLKKIDLCKANINKLTILGEQFPKLESLILGSCSKLSSLNLNGTFENLKEIQLVGSKLKEFTTLGTFPRFQFLKLGGILSLEKVNISGAFTALTSIDLSYAKIIDFDLNAGNCPNLKFLEFRHTENLKNLKLSGTFNQLCYLNLNNSGVRKLEVCGTNLPNITELNVSAASKIIFTGTFNKLTFINFHSAALEELYICAQCPQLEALDLRNTTRLRIVNLSGKLKNLVEINLSDTNTASINITNRCPNLQTQDPSIKFVESNREKRSADNQEEPRAKKSCSSDLRKENN